MLEVHAGANLPGQFIAAVHFENIPGVGIQIVIVAIDVVIRIGEVRRSAKPLEFSPSLLEGRHSIQLSYGRTSYVDSKSFIARKSTILARLRSAERADALSKVSCGCMGNSMYHQYLQRIPRNLPV